MSCLLYDEATFAKLASTLVTRTGPASPVSVINRPSSWASLLSFRPHLTKVITLIQVSFAPVRPMSLSLFARAQVAAVSPTEGVSRGDDEAPLPSLEDIHLLPRLKQQMPDICSIHEESSLCLPLAKMESEVGVTSRHKIIKRLW
ncbi:hypothetical protein Clacol_000842 [Clathrus columnatus]|uniref:Uncharacterized protein n=1 Tax=Clathrus columnatus TaxID=1419009 RepID=A0AAV4ZZI5_9AGAM|nr:hypothetical protein Clacol_000842 [Clathrus columnatus]